MAKRSRCLNIGAGLKPINLSQPSPDDPEENIMSRQTRMELKKELAILGWSIVKAMFFCFFVLALSWSLVTVAVTFQIIKLGG